MDFNYGFFQRDRDKDAFEEAQLHAQQQLDSGYKSQWEEQLKEAMDKILNREDFNYDFNGDAFYQQYKDKFTQQGKQAMMDTVGQQAALTGGYGNSWAQSAGQQAYHGQLDNLNDIIPELQKLALDKYNAEGEELYNRYGVIADMDGRDFQRWQEQEELKRWLATQDEDVRNYYLNFGRMPEEEDYEQGTGGLSGGTIGVMGGGGSYGGSGKKPSSGSSLQDIAMAVIRGDYGNGEARKKALAAAGYDPAEVQAAVNKLIAGGALGDGGDNPNLGPEVSDYDALKAKLDSININVQANKNASSAATNAARAREILKAVNSGSLSPAEAEKLQEQYGISDQEFENAKTYLGL